MQPEPKYSTKIWFMAVIAFFPFISSSSYSNDSVPTRPLCHDFADPVRVKVGGTEFHIPAIYHPAIFEGDKKLSERCRCYHEDGNGYDKGFCQTKEQPAFEYSYITINRGDFEFAVKKLNRTDSYLPHMQVLIDKSANAYGLFCKLFNTMRDAKPQQKHGYQYIEKGVYGSNYAGKSLIILTAPLIVICGAPSADVGSKCFTQFPWGDNTSIAIRFDTKDMPEEIWPQAFKEAEQFLLSITAPPLPKIDTTTCKKH